MTTCPRCHHQADRVEHRDDRTLYWHDDDPFPCSLRHDQLAVADDPVLVHLRPVVAAIETEPVPAGARTADSLAAVEAFRKRAVALAISAMVARVCDIAPVAPKRPGATERRTA